DGDNGLVILQPDEETIAHYRHEAEEILSRAAKQETLRDLPAVTADGTPIELLGNIEFPAEVQHCVDRGADGIGLYRTEFLYLGRQGDPTEADHLDAYMTVLKALPLGQPVVIRTLDLGADKFHTAAEPVHKERNPFLVVRSVRYF